MADIVNIGNEPNDGLGDDLRKAFGAVNTKFAENEQKLENLITSAGKIFDSRDDAVDFTQAKLDPNFGTIMTIEDGALVFRSPLAEIDDPLFPAQPRWGAVVRIDLVSAVTALQAVDAEILESISTTFDTGESDGDVWLAVDAAGNGLFAWTQDGFKTRFSEWVIGDLEERLSFSQPLEVLEGETEIVMEVDRNGNALRTMKTDGQDMIMSYDFWDRGRTALGLGGTSGGRLSETEWHAISVNGQSLSVGGYWNDSLDIIDFDTFMDSVNPKYALMLQGTERGDDVPILTIDMPRSQGYNNSQANGYGRAIPSAAVMTAAAPMAYLLNEYRNDMALSLVPVMTQCHGVSGIAIENIDSHADTGTGDLTVWNNLVFWNQQVAALAATEGKKLTVPWHDFVHGTSAAQYDAGVYEDALWDYQEHMREALRANGIEGNAVFIMTQSGGAAKITTAPWNVVDEQLAFCEKGGGVLATPLYAYEVADNNVHPSAAETIKFQEVKAYAMATVESGKPWTIARPKVTISGTTLTLHFDTLWTDEHLVQHSATRYNGEGIDGFAGFEVEGAAITSIAVRGHSVRLECDAVPTELRYAFQTQDVTGFADNRWSAHRGLLRTSHVWQSKIIDGEELYRWIPSFKIQL